MEENPTQTKPNQTIPNQTIPNRIRTTHLIKRNKQEKKDS